MRRPIGSADPTGAAELPPHHRRGCVVLERGEGCVGGPEKAHRISRKCERYARLDECSTGYTRYARRRRADVERPLRERVYEHLARAWRVFWRFILALFGASPGKFKKTRLYLVCCANKFRNLI